MKVSTKALAVEVTLMAATVFIIFDANATEPPTEASKINAAVQKQPTAREQQAENPSQAGASLGDKKDGAGTPQVTQPDAKTGLRAHVEAYEQVSLSARVTGSVEKIHVQIGERVKRGELLAELAVPDVVAELRVKEAHVLQARAGIEQVRASTRAAQAALLSVKSQVQEAENNLKSAQAIHKYRQLQLQRMEALSANKSIEASALDESRSQHEAAAATLAAAEARVQVAKANVLESEAKVAKTDADLQAAQAALEFARASVERVQVQLGFSRIQAPIDGLVTRRSVDLGSVVQAVRSANEVGLFTVANTDFLRISVQVPQASIAKISKATAVTVLVDAFPNRQFTAKVTRLAGTIDPRTQTMSAEIVLPNPEGIILPGMSVTVVTK